MLRQTFQQKLLQKLSPAQIQLMKLLQLPITSLEQRIKEEMEINPALVDAHYNMGTILYMQARVQDRRRPRKGQRLVDGSIGAGFCSTSRRT